MADIGETGPDNDAQQRQPDQGGDSWFWLELLVAPLEVIGLAIRAIGGLIAAIFAST